MAITSFKTYNSPPMTAGQEFLVFFVLLVFIGVIFGLSYFQYKMFRSNPDAYAGMAVAGDLTDVFR
jgi:hypothetical protein